MFMLGVLFALMSCSSDGPQYQMPDKKSAPMAESTAKSASQVEADASSNNGTGARSEEPSEVALVPNSCLPIPSSSALYPGEEGLQVKGSVAASEDILAPVLLEFVGYKEGQSIALYSVNCDSSTSFDFPVPRNLGELWLLAFVDYDGNGPTESDPRGLSSKLNLAEDGVDVGVISVAEHQPIEPLSLPLKQLGPPEPPVEDPANPVVQEGLEDNPEPPPEGGENPEPPRQEEGDNSAPPDN